MMLRLTLVIGLLVILVGIPKSGRAQRASASSSYMTADDKRELLEQLPYNAKSASRIAWHWISVSHS